MQTPAPPPESPLQQEPPAADGAEPADPQADERFRQELRDAALRRIHFLMDFYQVDPRELAEPRRKSARAPAPPAAPQPPKYRHPVSGETWDGVGSQPQWLREALLRQGYAVEDLKIEPGEDASA